MNRRRRYKQKRRAAARKANYVAFVRALGIVYQHGGRVRIVPSSDMPSWPTLRVALTPQEFVARYGNQ